MKLDNLTILGLLVVVPVLGVSLAFVFTSTGPAYYITEFQLYLLRGTYYPALTFVGTILTVALPLVGLFILLVRLLPAKEQRPIGGWKELGEVVALIPIGPFVELGCGTASIRDWIQNAQPAYSPWAASYLAEGHPLLASPGVVRDQLRDDPDETPIGSTTILTDGVYMWQDALSYYLREYAVALRDDVVEHMKKHGWSVKQNLDVGRLDYSALDDV